MRLRVVTFKVEEELIEEVDSFARILGINRSELIRRALTHYLKYLKKVQSNKVEYRVVRLYS